MVKYYSSFKQVILLLFFIVFQNTYAQCPGNPPGDQTSYGNNEWIGYVYSDIPNNALPPDNFSANYKGYITQPDDFEIFLGEGSISGPDLCGTYADNFAIRFKMKKTWTPGYYTFYVGADDGYRVSFDGGVTFVNEISDWADHGYSTKAVTLYMEGEKNMVLEYFEHAGSSRLNFDFFTATCTSTAPTGINGNTVVTCNGGTTLTATGGVNAIATYYQWGTGTIIGENIIPNERNEQITVHPSVNTTYWVRRVIGPPCADYTDGVSINITVGSAPAGDPTEFGDNIWHVYGYNNIVSLNPGTGYYSGYYTQDSLGFDTSGGVNSWPRNASPSSSPSWQGCPMDIDNFSFIHKRKGFPCGKYTLVMGNWDDDSRLYVNGQQVWQANGWSGGQANQMVGTFDLDENSTIELRTMEGGGDANAQLVITQVLPTAPTGINGNTSICSGAQTTLTATGGSTGTGYIYQWGTGTAGSNIIEGETSASITITPTEDTTYWVRIQNAACSTAVSTAATITVTTTTSGAGILVSDSDKICSNAYPHDIILTACTGSIVKWQCATNAAFTQNVTDIANTNVTLTGQQIGFVTETRYFRAVVNTGACGNVVTPAYRVTLTTPVTWNGSWSSTPDTDTAIIIESDLTLAGDLDVCSCDVKNTAALTVPEGIDLTVKGKITVDNNAKLIVDNKGTVIQVDAIANDGIVTVKRNSSKIKRLDYTLWSAPVSGQQLQSFSPQTLSNRFYIYNTDTNLYNSIDATGNFNLAAGYLIRTPNNHPTAAAVQNGTFKGSLNNGDITIALPHINDEKSYSAVGNPYASPISAADFIDANSSLIEGTLWFWRKTNDNSESRSYCTLTKFGYSANAAEGGENEFAVNPNGIINTAQGFIVKSKTAGQLVFNNNMRTGHSTNQFFRTSNPNTASRIWLNVTRQGAFSQTLLGYTAEATIGYDNGYDGRAILDGNINLYTLAADMKLAIQARPEFTTADIVPLGFKTATAGSFTFAINNADGLFTGNQAVYIKDNQLNLTHNLKEGSYTFTSEAGTFEDRFEIVYVPMNVLGENNPLEQSKSTVIYSNGKQLFIKAQDEIKSVEVYDLLGRQITNTAVNAQQYESAQPEIQNQVLIVKAIMADGSSATKKVVLK